MAYILEELGLDLFISLVCFPGIILRPRFHVVAFHPNSGKEHLFPAALTSPGIPSIKLVPVHILLLILFSCTVSSPVPPLISLYSCPLVIISTSIASTTICLLMTPTSSFGAHVVFLNHRPICQKAY